MTHRGVIQNYITKVIEKNKDKMQPWELSRYILDFIEFMQDEEEVKCKKRYCPECFEGWVTEGEWIFRLDKNCICNGKGYLSV